MMGFKIRDMGNSATLGAQCFQRAIKKSGEAFLFLNVRHAKDWNNERYATSLYRTLEAVRTQARLETQRTAQIDRTVAARRAYDTKRSAEYVGVWEAPARRIQDVVKAREQLDASFLKNLEAFGNRGVPLKRVLVAQEEQLPEFARRRVRQQEGRIGAAIRADQ